MRASRLAIATIALALVATTTHAQDTGRPAGAGAGGGQGRGMMMQRMKDELVGDLERQRKNVLDYVNIAPDSMFGFRATPGVRSYAQQIHHTASATGMIIGNVLGAAPMANAQGDTARLFTNKAALRDYVTAQYDYAIKAVRDAQPQAFMAEKSMFGMTRTGTNWVRGALEHGTWTLGQTVPYLRMNKVTPPSYLPF